MVRASVYLSLCVCVAVVLSDRFWYIFFFYLVEITFTDLTMINLLVFEYLLDLRLSNFFRCMHIHALLNFNELNTVFLVWFFFSSLGCALFWCCWPVFWSRRNLLSMPLLCFCFVNSSSVSFVRGVWFNYFFWIWMKLVNVLSISAGVPDFARH